MAFVVHLRLQHRAWTVGQKIAAIGVARTLGYAQYGSDGLVHDLHPRGLVTWMALYRRRGRHDDSTHVSGKVSRHVDAYRSVLLQTFEHSIVNIVLSPRIDHGWQFSVGDYFFWNETPTILGNLVGGLAFTGATLYTTHELARRHRDGRAAPQPRYESAATTRAGSRA
jgi:hypothetical protein